MKKIIFSVFPFREVLGLGLKILFHKNKEIKRMLSKKMAFSLMSLITLLALAFVTLPASAADPFDVTFEGRESVTYTTGQTETFTVTVTIKTGLSVIAYDLVNDEEDVPGTPAERDAAQTDERNLIVTAFDKNNIMVDNGATILEQTTTEGTGDPDYVATGTARDYVVTIDHDIVSTRLVAKVVVLVRQLTTNDLTAVDAKGAVVKTKLSTYTRVITVGAAPATEPSRPNVVSIQRLRPGSQAVVSAFEEASVTGPFDVKIVFTELPFEFALAKITVDGGTASNLVVGVPFAWHGGAELDGARNADEALRPHPAEGNYYFDNEYASLQGVERVSTVESDTVPMPTGPNGVSDMYHQYRVTITPHRRVDMVKISITEFHDNASPFPNVYKPFDVANKPNGREQLRLAVATDLAALGAGTMIYLPHAEGAQITYAVLPGHLIIAKNKANSGIQTFHEKDEENISHKQTPAQLLYNVRAAGLPNLENLLSNNGTIDLVSYAGNKAGDAYISEVMWGSDATHDDATSSQWIEIANGTSAAIGIGENKWALWFYQAHETPRATYVKDDGTAGVLIDRIGTKTFAGTVIAPATTGTTADSYWSITGKGSSGRTNVKAGTADLAPVQPTQALVSMYRGMVPDTTVGALAGSMVPGNGTLATSWMQSTPPSVNFQLGIEGRYVASPGSTRVISPAEAAATAAAAKAKAAAAAATAAKAADTSVSMPADGLIYISEVMFAGGGTLPQWIEISNGSRSEQVNLSDWTLTVENATADADVSVGAKAVFTIPDGTMIDPSGQDDTPSTILVVTEQGRTNLDGCDGSRSDPEPLDGSADRTDSVRCYQAQVFIVERYGVPNNACTRGADRCSRSESGSANDGSRNRSEESRRCSEESRRCESRLGTQKGDRCCG